MPEKNSAPSTSYSFEQLLGWFGRFTPQFKFRLLSMRRQLDAASFDIFVRETLNVFRAILIEIGREAKGPARARRVYAFMDQEYRATPPTGVSCAAGCGACCKSFPKQITDDEADLLAELIETGAVSIDRAQLRDQVESIRSAELSEQKNAGASPCVFLDDENRCRVYADRPAVCRKYHVLSPREACETEGAGVVPKIDLLPELIVSAAMSLPGNGLDFMALQLAKRLGPDLASVIPTCDLPAILEDSPD